MNSILTLVSEFSGQGFYVAQWKTSQLAIFSYYIQSKNESALIDPVFDIKTYQQFIAQRKSHLKFIFLTHYHADYLSGHCQFKVPIIMGPSAARAINKFKVKECTDGQVLVLGSVKLTVIHTPGHTLQSSCYLLSDSNNKGSALFSGDTVFLGEVGRPDLACSENITSHDLAAMLYESIQKIKKLEGSLRLYPGHGSGSACGKSIGAGNFCTVGAQNTNNYGFKFNSKQQFVKAVADNLPKPPRYFFHDAVLNQQGPNTYDHFLSTANVPLTEPQFLKLKDTCKVIDTRHNTQQGILRGSYWMSGNGSVSNFISNFVTPEEEFIIIVQKGKQIDIINRLFRIGYFNIKGYVAFDLTGDLIKIDTLNFEKYKTLNNPIHLDVRSQSQQQVTGVVENSLRIPLGEIEARIDELKGKDGLVVNCATGMRARLAGSVLAKYNIQAKVLCESFGEYKNNGIKVVELK